MSEINRNQSDSNVKTSNEKLLESDFIDPKFMKQQHWMLIIGTAIFVIIPIAIIIYYIS